MLIDIFPYQSNAIKFATKTMENTIRVINKMQGNTLHIKVIGKTGKIRKYRLGNKKKPKDEDKCAVCLCKLDDKTCMLECGHKFHTTCIFTWFKKKPSCPMCRSKVCLLNRTEVIDETPLIVIPPRWCVEMAYEQVSGTKKEWEEDFGKPMSDIDMAVGIIMTLAQIFDEMPTYIRRGLRDRDVRNQSE
jgi:hypothetical protein